MSPTTQPTKWFIRLVYEVEKDGKKGFIMKTYRTDKEQLNSLTDQEIKQIYYNTLCDKHGTDKVYLCSMLMCDENDDVVKHLC